MNAYFIRHPDAVFGREQLYYFRRTYNLSEPGEARVKIFADARYKLWVNGKFVSCGPCKGNRHLRYYDEVELTPYLKSGQNELFVTLLGLRSSDYMDDKEINIASVLRTGDAYLYLEGTVTDGSQTLPLVTDESWTCAEERHVRFTPQFFVGLNEHVSAGYGRDLTWKAAVPSPITPKSVGEDIPWGEILSSYAAPRPIPLMTYTPRELRFHDGYYDAGELTTGYIRLRARGHGKLTLRYGECFVEGNNESFRKGDRTDTRLYLAGHDDSFEVDGELDFESFWFRTFRFIKVCSEGEVEVLLLDYAETGYPLTVSSEYDFGSARDNALWDISVRTLRRCMHETYVDCPYYEQLQYCMDTYSQTLFTYMVTDDTRLAKRAIDDFAMTWRPGYLTEARAPSCKRQYIPGFSLFFIYMVNMYEARTEDTAGIRAYMPVIDGILSFFDTRRNAAGLIGASDMWDFVDWAEPWRADEGAPITRPGEGITVYTLMYAHALRCAARLQRAMGRGAVAEEYLIRADEVLEAVRDHCYDRTRALWADSERLEQFSQHAQIWAVLTGLTTGDEAKSLLRRSTELPAQGGYAYAYLWFRALEKADCYELSEGMFEQLYSLLDKHCTTIPETPYPHTRSECHAWGAVALYEFTTMILGVKLTDDSPRILRVRPRPNGQTHARGCAMTKWGRVDVAWQIEGDIFRMDLTTPPAVATEVIVPHGFTVYHVTLNGKEIPPTAVM
jgi:hypothetical protein